jgi:spermidine/putrescine transport system substrate-binding protein
MKTLTKLLRSPGFSITAVIVLVLLTSWYQNPGFYNDIRDSYLADNTITERTDTLRLYTFPNYFTDDILNLFENRFNVDIHVEYYESNEEMMSMLQQGKIVDVIVPTDYTVAYLSSEGLLEPIDRNKLPNYEFLDVRFREMDYDYANQFSIPYFWGSVGIDYNQNYVTGLPLSWNTMFDPSKVAHLRNRISILDDMRMTLGISLISLGYNPNTTNEDEIAEATSRLIAMLPYIRTIKSENLEVELNTDEVVMSMYWSGSSAKAANSNKNLRFLLPSEGSIFFVDNLAIPVNSTGKTLAFKFINFLLDPIVAARLTNQNFFANPVTHSRRYIDRIILKGPTYINPFLSTNIYVIENLGDEVELYEKYWKLFKDSSEVLIKKEMKIFRTEDRIILY